MSEANGSRWAAKEIGIYSGIQQRVYAGLCKISIVADPSVYQGQETVVGLIYSWLVKKAAYGMVQVLPSGKHLDPYEFEMNEELRARVLARKLERLSALREWQGISNMLLQHTRKSIDDFRMPSDTLVGRLKPGYTRLVVTSDPSINREWIVNDSDTSGELLAVPDACDPGELNQLTVQLDSGSIGRAGAAYCTNQLGYNVFVVWDKYHRNIRDLKLATEQSANGDINRALLHMIFVLSLKSKPYGSGTWYELKRALMLYFLQVETVESRIFRVFGPLIVKDWPGMNALNCEADWQVLWDSLPEAPGFDGKSEPVKAARWYSVNARHQDEKASFWVLKMLLVHHFGKFESLHSLDDVEYNLEPCHEDPRKELDVLKSNTGGMALAEKVLTPWLHQNFRIYIHVSWACWNWFSDQVERVKTPADGVKQYWKWSKGQWIEEIVDLFRNSFASHESLKDIGLDWNCSRSMLPIHVDVAQRIADFAFRLSGNRCFSMTRYEEMPYSYSGLLMSSAAAKEAAMTRMKQDCELLYKLESVASTVPAAATLLDDTSDLFPTPVRLLFITFCRHKWNVNAVPGLRVLASMLEIIPDSKSVEDVHQHVRDLTRVSRTLCLHVINRQKACVDSTILEMRGIDHSPVTKNLWFANWKQKRKKVMWRFNPKRHKMSQMWLARQNVAIWILKYLIRSHTHRIKPNSKALVLSHCALSISKVANLIFHSVAQCPLGRRRVADSSLGVA